MKTYIYRTLFTGVLVSSYLTHSQIRPNNNRGEYLRLDEVKDLKKRSTGETEFEDFSFNWNNGFHTALNNLALLEKVQVANLMSWHRKQFNLMKAEIEKQLNTSFNNYNQAKKAFFSSIERENITKNTPVILSKYERLYNSGKRKNRRYLRQLKFLQLRKIELREGNINNSQFSYIEVNGISLKEITLLSTLLKLESNIENAFENQISRNYEYRHTIEKLDYLGSSFERKMFRLKHEYYNGFSEWDKLGLMQFLLNYEHYKDIINCMVCILPDALLKFRNSDMATQPVIEEYAKSSSRYNVSLFDPRYPQIHRFKYQNNMCGGRIDLMAWEADKKAALDALVDDVSTRGLVIESLITELKITDNSQKNWLYSSSNSTEVSNLIDFLQKNRVHGVVAVEAVNFAKKVVGAKESNNYTNLFNSTLFTQNPYNVWKTLTQVEKKLIKQNWSEAYHIFKNRKVAEDTTRQKFNRNGLNDKSDAFRHAYYNAINAKLVGVDIAKLFSDAHESETPIRFIKEKRMDLFNNNIGQQSLLLNSNLSLTQLADLIYQKLLNGDLRYLKPINYKDPNFGYTHGITLNTLLKPTNQ